MTERENEANTQMVVKKMLWLLEYTHPDVLSGTLHPFYATDEREACAYVGDYLTQAAARGKRLEFRRLRAYPRGFSTGYTEWLGVIHVSADKTVVEGAPRRPIERVAYKGEAGEQGDVQDDVEQEGKEMMSRYGV